MDKQVFYRCSTCGNLALMIENSGAVPICCDKPMEKLTAGSVDASHEKHVPTSVCEDKRLVVSVGETPHPMTELHYIEWIYVQTNRGGHLRKLSPGCPPSARFRLCKDEVVLCIFSYCNQHGLWQACGENKTSAHSEEKT